jgi:hypothetical protein
MNRKDFGGLEAEYHSGRRRSRHHLSINMSDFVSRPQSFDGTTSSVVPASGLGPSLSMNSRIGCSMLLLPQGNPLGVSVIHLFLSSTLTGVQNKLERFFRLN